MSKTTALFICVTLTAILTSCRHADVADVADVANTKTKTSTSQLVDASCGQCQFGMDGEGCDLAIRIDGQVYYVDGTSIDDHGDAHSEAGFCNCVRKARVNGELKDGRFVATSFELLPQETDSVNK